MFKYQPQLKNCMQALCLLAMAASITGCGKTLEGKYADAKADISLTFANNGKVLVHSFRTDYPSAYKYAGNTIKVEITLTNVEFRVNDDGSLTGPEGMHLLKVN